MALGLLELPPSLLPAFPALEVDFSSSWIGSSHAPYESGDEDLSETDTIALTSMLDASEASIHSMSESVCDDVASTGNRATIIAMPGVVGLAVQAEIESIASDSHADDPTRNVALLSAPALITADGNQGWDPSVDSPRFPDPVDDDAASLDSRTNTITKLVMAATATAARTDAIRTQPQLNPNAPCSFSSTFYKLSVASPLPPPGFANAGETSSISAEDASSGDPTSLKPAEAALGLVNENAALPARWPPIPVRPGSRISGRGDFLVLRFPRPDRSGLEALKS